MPYQALAERLVKEFEDLQESMFLEKKTGWPMPWQHWPLLFSYLYILESLVLRVFR